MTKRLQNSRLDRLEQWMGELRGHVPLFVMPDEGDSYLLAQLPDPAANIGRYARVRDLWGDATRDVVIAAQSTRANGQQWAYWQPLRPTHARTRPIANNLALRPLRDAQVQFLTGTLARNVTVTLDPAMAWPGAMFEVAFDGALGLFSLNIAGLSVGGVLALLAGGRRRFIYDEGWRAF